MNAETSYPYASGDLLRERNTYFFSEYRGEPFLKAWAAQREAAVSRASAAGEAEGAADATPTPTDQLLTRIQSNMDAPGALTDLDRLVQRFEVTKRVYEAYREDWRAVDPARFERLETYVAFAEALSEAYAWTGVLTYLNALLKVTDTLTALAERLAGPLVIRLRTILRAEQEYVGELRRRTFPESQAPAGVERIVERGLRPLADVVLVASDSARARAYIQAFAGAGLRLGYVIILGEEKFTAPPLDKSPDEWRGLRLPRLDVPVSETCSMAGIPFRQLAATNINDADVGALLSDLAPEWVVFCGAGGMIVSGDTLRSGQKFLHAHSGWLPDYRGSTTLYYAMLNGEPPAVSVIMLDSGIDTGPVLARRRYPPPPAWMNVDLVYDCAVRADLMCSILLSYGDSGALSVEFEQSASDGRTYYVIHPVLKHLVLLSRRGVE